MRQLENADSIVRRSAAENQNRVFAREYARIYVGVNRSVSTSVFNQRQ